MSPRATKPSGGPSTGKDGLPVLTLPSRKAWFTWLEQNHASAPGCWLRIAKKGTEEVTVTYAEGVDGALCFGWIDSQVNKGDEGYYLQRFTPRRPKGPWSKINVGKVAVLEAAGEMREAGRREVEAAKADGRWDAAYAGPATITVPDDLAAALAANPKAAAFFDSLTKSQRYPFLYRVQEAKRPETRARRIATFIDKLANGETL